MRHEKGDSLSVGMPMVGQIEDSGAVFQRSDEIGMLAASSSQCGRVVREKHPIGVKPSSLRAIGHVHATVLGGVAMDRPAGP
jgi:hypothetical protein